MTPPRALAVLLLALAATACGGPQEGTGPDFEAMAIKQASDRLRGAWRLVDFKPETPLEPMLQALLQMQYEVLTVHFDGTRVRAESPGIHFNRPYEVRAANGDRFKLISYDESGVPYESQCEFGQNETLVIYSQTTPWRGMGTMRRATP
jgi:hypothetical protein